MISVHNIQNSYKKKIVIGLGFFDCVHLGHRKLFDAVKKLAISQNVESAVFTFSTNPILSKNNQKQIFTFQERTLCFEELGIDNVIYAPFSNEISQMSGEDFIDLLLEHFNVVGAVFGRDFKFGRNASWNAGFLEKYLNNKGIKVEIIDFFEIDGIKLSTSNIRPIIESGDIRKANSLLSHPYFIMSKIAHQNGRGHTFGLPTANMVLHNNKTYPSEGVYATSIFVDGKSFKSVTNVGKKPTFDDDIFAVESNIIDFDGNIYEKEVILIFWSKIRNIAKFESKKELIEQVEKDIKKRMIIEEI